MGLKVCISPNCWQRTLGTRCTDCEREYQQRRNAGRTQANVGKVKRATYVDAEYRRSIVYGDCLCCGTDVDITRHHVVPVAIENGKLSGSWVPMCRSCNSSIGDRIMADNRCPMHDGVIVS